MAAPLWAELLKGRALLSAEAPPLPSSLQSPFPSLQGKLSSFPADSKLKQMLLASCGKSNLQFFNVKMQKYPASSSLLPFTPASHHPFPGIHKSTHQAFAQTPSPPPAKAELPLGPAAREPRGEPCTELQPEGLGPCPCTCIPKWAALGESCLVSHVFASERPRPTCSTGKQ